MIAIVDYGLGNIKAFVNIYKRLNVPVFLASDVEALSKASKIILPGVGAFDYAMSMLNESGLRSTLDFMVLERKTPVLGVCVGMQMMASSSEEGELPGMGWISGSVKRLHSSSNVNSDRHPLPHMGWNCLQLTAEDKLFSGFDKNPMFYFLHSYYFHCDSDANVIARASYGQEFACIVKRENIYGVQCHPEKSHHDGVSLLRNFASL